MLLDDLVGTIETLKERIATHGPALRQNETRTRAALIDPLLQALGWDVSDPSLVTPEYRVDVGWADYALLGVGRKPAAVIEAKRLGSIVENHLDQAVGYCIQQGIAYVSVTDGSHWQLFRTFEPVPLVEKLVLDVSIADTPAHEAALKLLLLWRSNLASGQPVAANAPVLAVLPSTLSAVSTPIIESDATIETTATSNFSQGVGPTPPSTHWMSLNDVDPNKKLNPPPYEVKFATGETRPVKYWWNVLAEVAEWLVRNRLLTAEDCPLSGLGFIDSVAHSSRAKRVSGGIYLNVTLSASLLAKNSRQLLNHFGIDPKTVELLFE